MPQHGRFFMNKIYAHAADWKGSRGLIRSKRKPQALAPARPGRNKRRAERNVERFLTMLPSSKTSIFAAALLLAAASGAQASAGELIRAGFCLPGSTRFTKCIDGKIAECTRSRNVKCKTRQTCRPTQEHCKMPVLPR